MPSQHRIAAKDRKDRKSIHSRSFVVIPAFIRVETNPSAFHRELWSEAEAAEGKLKQRRGSQTFFTTEDTEHTEKPSFVPIRCHSAFHSR